MKRQPANLVRFSVASAMALIPFLGLTACNSGGTKTSPSAPAAHQKIELRSTAFAEGQPIPKKYTAEGKNVSPPLRWSKLPAGTKELALICDDPDAPSPKNPRPDPWVHWVIYRIPAAETGMPEGVARQDRLDKPSGVFQGQNSWPKGENIGYLGPEPPPGSGTHRYFFKLYALDEELALEPGLDKASLRKVIEGHVLGEGHLMGTYQR